MNKEKQEDHNMSLVGFRNTRILTDYAQKSMWTLFLSSNACLNWREGIIAYECTSHPSNINTFDVLHICDRLISNDLD